MPWLNGAEVDAIKARITDPDIRTLVEHLEHENNRLYSHHSECKQEAGRTLEIAQRWRIQAFVVENLVRWLNQRNPFWFPADLEKEIRIHTDRLMDKWRRREDWMEDEESAWEGLMGAANG